ncbi:MAG: helix-turn-helix domain-containing protein [Proteobacteria bacterium]|nr:helix-turn-helix domain-containing protein [Pseudomonadota bacterium]
MIKIMVDTNSSGRQNIGDSSRDYSQEFAKLMQKSRIDMGVTVEAVAQATKISKHFIVALERGSFEGLPGQVFGRGFVKSISRYLKINDGSLLALYDLSTQGQLSSPTNSFPATASGVSANITLGTRNRSWSHVGSGGVLGIKNFFGQLLRAIAWAKYRSRTLFNFRLPPKLLRMMRSQELRLMGLSLVAGIMVLVFFVGWLNSKSTSQSTDIAAPNVASEISPNSVAENAPSPNLPIAVQTSVSDSQSAQSAQAILAERAKEIYEEKSVLSLSGGNPIAFDQIIEINVIEATEVKLTVDGKRAHNGILEIGKHSFSFHSKADLHLTDASVVDVSYNGNSLGVLGSKGRRRKIAFQAKAAESDFPY